MGNSNEEYKQAAHVERLATLRELRACKAERDRLREVNAAMAAALRKLEWCLPVGYFTTGLCPCCKLYDPRRYHNCNGHAPDCTLAAALARATESIP